jgi:hypothetical protein
MPLLVDTSNVLHTQGVLPADLAGIDVADLVSMIESSRYRRGMSQLICDGSPPPGFEDASTSLIHVAYAGPGREADDLIIAMIQTTHSPRQLVVVSSDREIARAARVRRCRSLTSEEFLHQLAMDSRRMTQAPLDRPAPRPRGPLTQEQIEYWAGQLGVHGLDPSTLEPPADAEDPPAPASPEQPALNNETKIDDSLPPQILEEAERLWSAARRRST